MIGPEIVLIERITLEVAGTGRAHVGFRELGPDGEVRPDNPIAMYEACNLDDAGDRREITVSERDAKPRELRCLRCLPGDPVAEEPRPDPDSPGDDGVPEEY